jgi:hypothetical protein
MELLTMLEHVSTDCVVGEAERVAPPLVIPQPKFFLDIERKIIEWPVSTVTTEQIIELGGWDQAKGVLMVNSHNDERQLKPCEVVHLEPGLGFAKKVHWKRG